MKAYDNGCFFSVTITRREVENFKDTWPCSTLREHPVWAQFDKRNGDLVDLSPHIDGDDACALIQDGQNYAAAKLGLPEHCFRR